MNESALLAARQNRKVVTMSDFEVAKDKVLMGAERRSMILTEEDKRITAFHEAGHALVAALLPESDPLHKVSIIPRGRALGVTMQLPEGDVLNRTQKQLTHQRDAVHQPALHRSAQRHRAGDGSGAGDGVRLRHE